MELNYQRIILEEETRSLILYSQDLCLYRCKQTRGNTKYMECTEVACSARGKIVLDGNFIRTSAIPHSHQGNHHIRAEYESALQRMRELVREQINRGVKEIYSEVYGGLSLEAAGYVNWENCRQTLQRIRHRLHPPCQNLDDLEALLEDEQGPVFEQYGQIHGERIYIGAVNGQMLFANQTLISHLPGVVELYVDGTFGVTPFRARQLLVVMAELQGRPRPIMYAIMSSQTTADYESILRFLGVALLGVRRAVLSVTSDFEQAIRAAVLNVWPQAEIIGCNFHHCQALERHAKQSPGLAGGKLADGTPYRHILRMFKRISLLPLRRIDAGFAAILDYIQEQGDEEGFEPDDFDEFAQYFQQTWFTRFTPTLWCVSDRDRRTNNNVEGHNRKIKGEIHENPSPWEFLQGLRDLMLDACGKFERDRRTNAPPPEDLSLITVRLKAALQRLINDEIDELEFLKTMV